jgi:vitamin B12 transporter
VADALRYFSGLQLKDYGGVGGIKTVNIRSMGIANNLFIYNYVFIFIQKPNPRGSMISSSITS